MKPNGLNREFIVIGENIHTTRIVLRQGKLITTFDDGREAVRYTTGAGETRYLPIPDDFKRRQDYEEGRVKHVMIAIRDAMAGGGEGMIYLRALIDKQVKAGADYLDLNVDEISLKLNEQIAAIEWLVKTVESLSPVPVAVDSSNLEILRAGLAACEGKAGRPMLNSASLERLDALDTASKHRLPVVVTAAGESGMPQDDEARVLNASRMVDAAVERGLPLEDLYVDPLVFPISVDGAFGNHCLDAIRKLRARYGPAIHISGGLSNVSFGLPCRKLINEVFLNLAVDAGADSGIVDPVANDLNKVFAADKQAGPYKLAEDMLLGRDRNCKNFLRAYRKGELGQ